ncbi:MAG: hypothetical protein QM718_14565 [Steroidobacteraceae bacterium]
MKFTMLFVAPLAALSVSAAVQAAAPPDLYGPWIASKPVTHLKAANGSAPPLTELGEKLYAQNQSNLKADPLKQCLPGGNPRMMNVTGFPFNVVQGTKYYAVMFEWNHRQRIIYMNSEHFKNLGPGYFGQSIGHWEGDTLVVDTTRYNDRAWLDDSGLPHSKQLHTIERIRLRDANTLQVSITFSDPTLYSRDWTAELTYTRKPGVILEEDNCIKRLGLTLESKAQQN